MDPTLSGFALGLLFGAAKIGFIGTVGFAVAWWRARSRLRQLEAALPDPGILEQRLASLEQAADYSAAKLDQLVEAQAMVARLRIGAEGHHRLAEESHQQDSDPLRPHTPH